MTVGDGVAQTVEERLASLETRVAELEARLMTVEGGDREAAPTRTVVTSEFPITARLLDKRFNEGRIQNYLMFELEFQSALQQPIIAFTGVAIFRDVAERELLRLNVTSDERLDAGEAISWFGGIAYDPERDGHTRMREVPREGLRLHFDLDAVTYANGMRETFTIR
jgi:uncharacterized coiled-coil protein SlyX